MGHWSTAHMPLLIISLVSLSLAASLGRFRPADLEPYQEVAFRRFRIALAILGIGGFIGLIRLWMSGTL